MPRSSPKPSYNLNTRPQADSPLRRQAQNNPGSSPSTPVKSYPSSPVRPNSPGSAQSSRILKGVSKMDPAGDRLASLLAENYLVRKQWNQFVLVKGAAIGSEIIMLREEMTRTLSSGYEPVNPEGSKDAYELKMTSKIEDSAMRLADIVLEINKVYSRMVDIEKQAYELLIEYSKNQGIQNAFFKPLWSTWPMSQFVYTLESLGQYYRRSLDMIHECFTTITDHGSSTSECQAAMSFWVCQPHLPKSESSESAKWFDDVCDMEVPAWSKGARSQTTP